MLTIHKLIPQGQGLAAVLLKRAPSIELDWDTRQKSRFDATDSAGRHLGIFLPRGSVVRGGDVLLADDGSLVRVLAAAQPVMQVRICPQHGQPLDLLRAAYHLGNRHVTLAVAPDVLTLERDHVLADLLDRMHLIVTDTEAPFEPEAGAYAAGGHGHAHEHGHDPAPAGDAHAHAHDHDHGDDCGCGHAHGHEHDHAHPAVATGARGKPVPVAVRAAPAAGACGHDHAHDHPHDHAHDHGQGHDHDHPHDHGHPHRH